MRGKWFQSLKRFVELFTPGGTEYDEDGVAIVYSRTGGMTIPRSEYSKLRKIHREREEALRRALLRANKERAG